MTVTTQTLVRWTLAAAAFTTVLATTSGCSLFQHKTVAVVAPAPRPFTPPPAPAVDVFGDLDGHSPTPASTANSTLQQHTNPSDGRDADVSLDPSGHWLVFTSTRHNEHPKIYLQKVHGHTLTQLTADDADDANPTFSPDGKWIAFASTRSGSWDLYTMDTAGKHVTQLTSGPAQDLHPTFSPDGQYLGYCSSSPRSGQWELWTLKLSTGERRMIGYGLFPAWCPDKTVNRIAFQRAPQRGSRLFSLWTLDLVDGEARALTEIAAARSAALVSPAWSPDGAKLAFTAIPDPDLSTAQAHPAIWTVDGDGDHRRRVTDTTAANLSPFWGVDDRVYFVSDRTGPDAIWSANPDTAAPADAVAAAPAPAAANMGMTLSAKSPAKPEVTISPAPIPASQSHEAHEPQKSEVGSTDPGELSH